MGVSIPTHLQPVRQYLFPLSPEAFTEASRVSRSNRSTGITFPFEPLTLTHVLQSLIGSITEARDYSGSTEGEEVAGRAVPRGQPMQITAHFTLLSNCFFVMLREW